MFPGTLREYLALDSVPAAEAAHFPTKFLDLLDPLGFPRYKLRLKIGTPIMLLRILNPPDCATEYGCKLRLWVIM